MLEHFSKDLLWVRLLVKLLVYALFHFILKTNLMQWKLFLAHFYRWENWGIDWLSSLTKAKQAESVGTWI